MEFIFEFLGFLAQAIFWVFIILVCLILFNVITLRSNQQETVKITKKLNDIVHRVNVEKHHDIYYWFDEDNGEFLGQGRTDHECIEHIKKRFPDHLFFFPDNRMIKAPNWNFEKYVLKKNG